MQPFFPLVAYFSSKTSYIFPTFLEILDVIEFSYVWESSLNIILVAVLNQSRMYATG